MSPALQIQRKFENGRKDADRNVAVPPSHATASRRSSRDLGLYLLDLLYISVVPSGRFGPWRPPTRKARSLRRPKHHRSSLEPKRSSRPCSKINEILKRSRDAARHHATAKASDLRESEKHTFRERRSGSPPKGHSRVLVQYRVKGPISRERSNIAFQTPRLRRQLRAPQLRLRSALPCENITRIRIWSLSLESLSLSLSLSLASLERVPRLSWSRVVPFGLWFCDRVVDRGSALDVGPPQAACKVQREFSTRRRSDSRKGCTDSRSRSLASQPRQTSARPPPAASATQASVGHRRAVSVAPSPSSVGSGCAAAESDSVSETALCGDCLRCFENDHPSVRQEKMYRTVREQKGNTCL